MKNSEMKNRVKKIMVLAMVAVITLPAMAQWSAEEQERTTAPSTSFQSTSTMQSSGSAYSTTPTLNADGTATYEAAGAPEQVRSSGPRKVIPPTPSGDPTPVGDGAWALIVMAGAYAALRIRRKAQCSNV